MQDSSNFKIPQKKMSAKKLVWIGFFLGSTVGGMIPSMWGADMLSISGFVWSFIGGVAGIWAGYRIAKNLGV